MLDFTNKIIIITGGGSGIGKAASLAFAKQGAILHIIELNKEQAEETVAAIKMSGGKASAHNCDVSNQQQVSQIFKEIGNIDVLVNNAGIAHIGKADTTNEVDFDRVFNVNVKGYYNCMHEAIPLMKEAGKGVILNVCSVAAQTGIAERFAYSMSKGAVYAMTLSVARDYIDKGIRCNCISPARVHTPFVDDFIKKNYAGREAEMFEKLTQRSILRRSGSPLHS